MAFCLSVLCVFCLPLSSRAETTPLMSHIGWQRLDELVGDFPFAWARRYLELKSIAEDTDNYSLQLPLQLQRLQEVTVAAQRNVITLLLDLVPATANVPETSYLVGLLENWKWRLEPPLRRTAATAAGLEQSLEVLAGIGQAVEEMQANTKKRPIMEKASQDFYDLYTLVQQRVDQLYTSLYSVRSAALGLYTQIEKTTVSSESQLPGKWVAYYTTPLTVTRSAVSRLGTDFVIMCQNWTYDEGYPASLPFAIVFNLLILISLLLMHAALSRTASSVQRLNAKRTFMQRVCCAFQRLDLRRKLALALCVLVMLNSIVDTLPQFHEVIPFLFVQQILMAVGLAIWARTVHDDPAVWELALPVVVGLLLLHGDAGSLLLLLGTGAAMITVLLSMLLKRVPGQSALRIIWLAVLLVGLLMTVMGFGRLAVPFFMLILVIRASMVILRVVNNNPELLPYTMERAWFVPVFTLFLCVMSIGFLVGCPGFGMLRNYWYVNAVPIFGFSMTLGDAVMTVFFLLGMVFVSNLSRQILENLGQDSRVLDASAVPVLHVVVNCLLAGIFGCFVMFGLGVDVSSMAFIGGGVSIGVGFAAKTILSNFFCGLVIIFSKVVRAGDMVEISGVNGKVLSVNMRATVVETLSNGILLVPNEELLNSRLTNWSLNNLHVMEIIAISVAPTSDMNVVLASMTAAADSVAGVMKEPQPKALFIGFGEYSMEFELYVWVRDVRYKFDILSDVRRALRSTLEERGVVLSGMEAKRLDVRMLESESRIS